MTGIFISYREDDTKAWALMLAEDLDAAFGKEYVFLDKDTLHAGHWREQIVRALDQADVVLLVIGRKWLSITDSTGQRRLDDPADVHRKEVALALSRPDTTVIPILVDHASLPRSEDLPQDIRTLTECQSRELSDDTAGRSVDLAQLIQDIERLTGLSATHKTREPRERGNAKRLALPPLRVLITTIFVSVVTLLILELGFGWTLIAGEKIFVVLLVFLATLAFSKLRKSLRGPYR